MNSQRSLRGLGLALLLLAVLPTAGAAPAVVALTGGTVVGIDDGRPINNAVVIITGERITAVGPAATRP